ncbi:hypothetical protein COOONC_18258 [Cooperia oncophora]
MVHQSPGILNILSPARLIEEYIDEGVDLIFSERLENWELATETYLVRKSQRSLSFLKGLADYHSRVPTSLHDKPSAIIHEYLAEVFPPTNSSDIAICRWIGSKHLLTRRDDLLYQACVRRALNPYNRYSIGGVKILPKASGWVRESRWTNSKWSLEGGFMMQYGNDSDMMSNSNTPVP